MVEGRNRELFILKMASFWLRQRRADLWKLPDDHNCEEPPTNSVPVQFPDDDSGKENDESQPS